MQNSPIARMVQLTSFATSLLFSASLSAESYKKISRTIDAATLRSVEIEVAIAEMEIEFYDGDEIELEIELEADGHWMRWRRGDVDDIDLELRTTGDRAYLGIANQKVQQHWRVKMPSKLAIAIDVGVGDIELDDFSNNLNMEVGVGSVRVDIDDTDYAVIRASAGVGDTSISGFSGKRVDNERTFMSSESYHHGDGKLEIDIEVGVGDVQIRSR